MIVTRSDPTVRAPGYDSWWDVAVAEVSEMPSVQAARRDYEQRVQTERVYL